MGAGVQSSVMALMAAKGEIEPMPDCAIFADTQAEPQSVYRWLDWLETQLPYPVHRVTKGNLAEDGLILKYSDKSERIYQKNLIPLYVKKPEGGAGILYRKCTGDYKIQPIKSFMRKLLNVKRGEKEVQIIQWIGISTDEAQRMKDNRDAWIENRYPLIEKWMSRNDCLRWMENHHYPVPPRSACVFCPYHNDREWLRLKTEEPEEFQKAVEWERRCQEQSLKDEALRGTPFLHKSLVPLDQVQFEKNGQANIFNYFNNDCEGMCGV